MKKQFLIGALASSIIFSGVSTFAQVETLDLSNNTKIELINGDKLEETKGENHIEMNKTIISQTTKDYKKGDTVMVPLREIAEGKLGLKITWNNEDRSIEIGEGPQWTSIKIGENSYFYAKIAPFELSQAPEIKDGLTYVPVGFFSEVLKYNITIDKEIPKEENILDGFIKDIHKEDGKGTILVGGNENNKVIDEILLHLTKDTVIVDKENKTVKFDELKSGTKIKTILPEIMTMSLPPQGTAIKIIVEDDSVEILKIKDKDNKDIVYPEIKGLENKSLQSNINKEIKDFVKEVEKNEIYKDLKMNPEINFLNDNIISIVFRGSYKLNDGEKYLVKSLNFNLKTGKEITFESYFKDDKSSQGKLNELLNKQAKEQGLSEFEAEGKWIQFRGSKVIVFYYPLDDSVEMPVELYISLEDVKDLVK